jgi:hypothetical protein
LLTQGLTRSLQRELNSFYQKLQKKDFLDQHVTKGAFSRARAKLKPEAFSELNDIGQVNFYKNAPWHSWNGFRLLACDGSTAMLPNHSSIVKEFGITSFGRKGDPESPHSMARISLLYDVLNFVTLDGKIASYNTSEKALLRQHLKCIRPKNDLLILDRGYPTYKLMFELQALGIHYCIRLQDEWWLEVRKMLKDGDNQKTVVFQLSKKEEKLRALYPDASTDIRCRLLVVELADGSKEILCTSLLDDQQFPVTCFAELYHFRWNIEEGYKLYKSRMDLEAFSGKTALAVKQDFYAGIFMMTTAAVMAFPVAEEVKQLQGNSKRKHPAQVNRVNAVAMIRDMAINFFQGKMISKALMAFDNILRRTVEIVRPGRSVSRKKGRKKPPAMNYKRL